jgi:hypothetical protein
VRGGEPRRPRVEVLGQRGVDAAGDDEHDEAHGDARAVGRRVRAGHRPREERAREDEVRLERPVDDGVVEARRVERGAVEHHEAAHVQRRGGHGMGEHAHHRGAQEGDGPAAAVPAQGAEQQAHGRPEDEAQRRRHPEEEVLGHVGARVGVVERSEPDGDEPRPGEERRGAPAAPRRQRAWPGREQREVAAGERRRDEHGHQPRRPGRVRVGAVDVHRGHVDREHGQAAPRRARHPSAAPTSTSTRPARFHARSYGASSTP